MYIRSFNHSLRLGSGADAMGAPPKAVTAACSIHSFIQSCIEARVQGRCNGGSPKSCDSSLQHSFIHSLIHSFIRPSIHLSIHSLIHSFVHSLIHSLQAESSRSWLQIITMTASTASAHDKFLIQAALIHMIAEMLTVKAGPHTESMSGMIKIDNTTF